MDFAARRILPERFCGKCVLLKIEIFELEDARNDTEPIREICFAGGPGAGDIPDGPLGANATRARITPSRHTRDHRPGHFGPPARNNAAADSAPDRSGGYGNAVQRQIGNIFSRDRYHGDRAAAGWTH